MSDENHGKVNLKPLLVRLVMNDFPHLQEEVRGLRVVLFKVVIPLLIVVIGLILTLHTV